MGWTSLVLCRGQSKNRRSLHGFPHYPCSDFGWQAPDFSLPGVDGRTWTLQDAMGPNGLLVMFICNHCPYVKAIRPRLVRDLAELRRDHAIAIMSNDPTDYAEDSFDNMKAVSTSSVFPFPTSSMSRSRWREPMAQCARRISFGFNRDARLQYRGRFEASRKETAPDVRRDLFEAMKQVATSQGGPAEQIPSMGCSIKWKGE